MKFCVSYLRYICYLDLVAPQLAVSTEQLYQISADLKENTRNILACRSSVIVSQPSVRSHYIQY